MRPVKVSTQTHLTSLTLACLQQTVPFLLAPPHLRSQLQNLQEETSAIDITVPAVVVVVLLRARLFHQ